MSKKSKLAAIAAASIGMVLTQASAPCAKTEDSSAPEKVTKIAASIDWGEEVFYSAIPDDVLEKAAGSGLHVAAGSVAQGGCSTTAYCSEAKPVKKPRSSSSKKQKQ